MMNYYRITDDRTGQTLASFQSNGVGGVLNWFTSPSSQKVWAKAQELLFTEVVAANG